MQRYYLITDYKGLLYPLIKERESTTLSRLMHLGELKTSPSRLLSLILSVMSSKLFLSLNYHYKSKLMTKYTLSSCFISYSIACLYTTKYTPQRRNIDTGCDKILGRELT